MIPVIVSLVTTAVWIGYSIWTRNHPPVQPETHMTVSAIIGYIVVALLGYFARHYHLNIPFLPQTPVAPVSPVAPAPVDPTKPALPSINVPETGRPLLDLAVQALLAAEVGSPTAQAAILAEAEAIKKILDAANIPSPVAPNK